MTTNKFRTLLEKGWSLDHIFILENMQEFPGTECAAKEASLLQTLFRKGLIDEKYTITKDGESLLLFANNEEIGEIVKIAKPKIASGIEGLHKKLEDKLMELTGKKQQRPVILGTKYSFLCGKEDLEARIKKVMIKYKLSDYQLLETTLLEYIERCYKTNRWSPLLQYYIIKQKEGVEMSPLVTDMRSRGEKEIVKTEFEI